MTSSGTGGADPQAAAFACLADPGTHAPGTGIVERIDTHSAVIFLAGPFAYKVKRAVRFPFLDFSTLEKRRAACAAEVAINRDAAPGLYLGTVAVVRGPEGLSLATADAPGAVEYAVKMRRFDTAATLDRQPGPLDPGLVAALARKVVAAHAAAAPARGWDVGARLAAYLADNAQAFAAEPALFPAAAAAALAARSEALLSRLGPLFAARSAAGHVRRCHGDLHLRNIVLLDGEPVLFDAVEFSDDIATCDVLYDLAFLIMDLWQRGRRAEANALLNRYLWATADETLDGLAALPLFLSLRAAIRAKVEAAGLVHLSGAARTAAEARVRHFFDTAGALIETGRPELLAVGGLSGSGKSTFAARIAPATGRAPGAVVLRSDIERKRLAGIGESERLPASAYTPEASAKVYARLSALAARVLAAGHGVIVDAVHARPDERAAIEQVARAAGAPFRGVWLEAPRETLIARVGARTGDASDADADVVRQQLAYDLGAIGWERASA